MAVAMAEACFGVGLGADIEVDLAPLQLFSETQARALVAVASSDLDTVLAAAEAAGVPAVDSGAVGGDRLLIRAGWCSSRRGGR